MTSQIDNSQVFKIKGIQTDNEPTLQDSTYAFNLKNMCITRVGDLFALTNIEGTSSYPIYMHKLTSEKNVDNFYTGFKQDEFICGAITINNENIILVTSVKEEDNTYTAYFYRLKQHPDSKVQGYYLSTNTYDKDSQIQKEEYDKPFYIWKDSNITPEHPLQIVNAYENNLLSKIYWIDGVNPLRSLDLEGNNVNEQISSSAGIESNLYNNEYFYILYSDQVASTRALSMRKWLLYYTNIFSGVTSLICESKWFNYKVTSGTNNIVENDTTAYKITIYNITKNKDVNGYIIVRQDRLDNGTILYSEVAKGILEQGQTKIEFTDLNQVQEGSQMWGSPTNIYEEFNNSYTTIANSITIKDQRLLLGNINRALQKDQVPINTKNIQVSTQYSETVVYNKESKIAVDPKESYYNKLGIVNYYDDSDRHFKFRNVYRLGFYLISNNGIASKIYDLGAHTCGLTPKVIYHQGDITAYQFPVFQLKFPKSEVEILKQNNVKFIMPVYGKQTYETRRTIAQGLWMPTSFEYGSSFLAGISGGAKHYIFPYIDSLYHMQNISAAIHYPYLDVVPGDDPDDHNHYRNFFNKQNSDLCRYTTTYTQSKFIKYRYIPFFWQNGVDFHTINYARSVGKSVWQQYLSATYHAINSVSDLTKVSSSAYSSLFMKLSGASYSNNILHDVSDIRIFPFVRSTAFCSNNAPVQFYFNGLKDDVVYDNRDPSQTVQYTAQLGFVNPTQNSVCQLYPLQLNNIRINETRFNRQNIYNQVYIPTPEDISAGTKNQFDVGYLPFSYPYGVYNTNVNKSASHPYEGDKGGGLVTSDAPARFIDHTMSVLLSPDVIYNSELDDYHLQKKLESYKLQDMEMSFVGILPNIFSKFNYPVQYSSYPFYIDNESTVSSVVNADFLSTSLNVYYGKYYPKIHNNICVGFSKISGYGENNTPVQRDISYQIGEKDKSIKYIFYPQDNLASCALLFSNNIIIKSKGKNNGKFDSTTFIKDGKLNTDNLSQQGNTLYNNGKGITIKTSLFNNCLILAGTDIIKPGIRAIPTFRYRYVYRNDKLREKFILINRLETNIAPFDASSWVYNKSNVLFRTPDSILSKGSTDYYIKQYPLYSAQLKNTKNKIWGHHLLNITINSNINWEKISIPGYSPNVGTSDEFTYHQIKTIYTYQDIFSTIPELPYHFKWGISDNFGTVPCQTDNYRRQHRSYSNSKYYYTLNQLNIDDINYIKDEFKVDECSENKTIDIVDVSHTIDKNIIETSTNTIWVKGNELSYANRGCNIDNPNNIDDSGSLNIRYTLGDTYFGITKAIYSMESDVYWKYACAIYFPCESYYNINYPYVDNVKFANKDQLKTIAENGYEYGVTNLHRCGTGYDYVNPELYNYQYKLDTYSYPTQIIVSEPKTSTGNSQEVQLYDPWFQFRVDPYYLESTYGPIWALQSTEKYIYAFQETGISRVLFNQLGSISTDPNVPAYLGATGQFQGHQYIIKEGGCKDQHSTISNSNGIYCYDNNTKSLIFVSDDKIANLTMNKKCRLLFQSNFSDAQDKVTYYIEDEAGGVKLLYDSKDQRVLVQNRTNCIIYSEVSGEFETVSDYKSLFHLCNIDNSKRYFTWGGYSGIIGLGTAIYNKEHFTFINSSSNLQILNTEMVNQEYILSIIANSKTGYEKIFNTLSYRSEIGRQKSTTLFDTLLNSKLYLSSGTQEDGTPFRKVYNNKWTHPIFKNIQVNTAYQQASKDIKFNLYAPSNIKAKYRTWSLQLPRGNGHLYNRLRDHYVQITLSTNLKELYLYDDGQISRPLGDINKFRIHDLKVI